jgi:hypothetical protein
MTAGIRKLPFRVVYSPRSMAQEPQWILAHNSARMTGYSPTLRLWKSLSVALISCISPVVIWRADDMSRNCSAVPKTIRRCTRLHLVPTPTIGSGKRLDLVLVVLELRSLPAYCSPPRSRCRTLLRP